MEIPLAVAGAVAAPLPAYAMGFAAGGMLYVIGDEIVPETHSRGYERVATRGLFVGAAVTLILDVVLAARACSFVGWVVPWAVRSGSSGCDTPVGRLGEWSLSSRRERTRRLMSRGTILPARSDQYGDAATNEHVLSPL